MVTITCYKHILIVCRDDDCFIRVNGDVASGTFDVLKTFIDTVLPAIPEENWQCENGKFYPTGDAYVATLWPDANFGDDDSLSVLKQRRGDGSIWVQMSFLRFQLSEPLPASIILHIYCAGDYLVQNHNLRIGKPNADWNENTITWNTKPLSTTKETISTNDINFGWNEITINPSLYHLGGGVISIVLSLDYIAEFGTNNQAGFRSKESGNRPYLKLAEEVHDTTLTIDIVDAAGNPITESVVGETIYIAGQLRDIVDNVALQGALIALYRNGIATGKTDATNSSGIYSIPYTITKADADIGIVKFKTHFTGT